MTKIVLFTAESLAPAIAEGSKGFVNQQQWVSKMLGSFSATVRRRPLSYRSFGPFWWPIKRLMIESGDLQGETPDPAEVERITLGTPALDVAAAWAYSEFAASNQTSDDNMITVDTEDGDTFEYLLNDEEMEAMPAMTA